MITLISILCGLLLLAGIVGSFLSMRASAAFSFLGYLGIAVSRSLPGSDASLVFWGVATVIALAISYMLPVSVATSRRGVGYIVGAIVAGAFVGLIVSHAWMIIGAVVGAILGAIAYSRTPQGRSMGFPSSRFFNYLCAKGLPAVVSVCIVATAVEHLAAFFK